MSLRSKIGWTAAALFMVINVAGTGYALALQEGPHAAVHVALVVVGVAAYLVWRRWLGMRRQSMPDGQVADARVEYLQQSIDAVALEVERVGEAQRFSEKLRMEKGEAAAVNKRSAD